LGAGDRCARGAWKAMDGSPAERAREGAAEGIGGRAGGERDR
jgi:hypothetical protein